ncbi:MAG: hypothetical protein J7K15_06150, partial [Deltaproteobacteria bacterium]|nr:hypothetical protein [Deltaproteobacteria bacterium]
MSLLGKYNCRSSRGLKNTPVDEAACARYYWREYFSIFGLENVVRHGEDDRLINAKLNYGYA